MSPPLVVVGVDGSPEAEAALMFAAEEARLRGGVLRIVCAWEPSASAYAGEAFAATADVFLESERYAEDVLRSALARVGGEVEAEALVEEGRAASVLVEQSDGATLLVVGSRGLGAAKRVLLGSVSTHLSHHVTCPLVIVPHRNA